MLRKFLDGVAAGVMITIGCAVYLACSDKYVGAVLFSVALLTICMNGYSLFTGKVGFIPEKHGKEELLTLFFGLLGNAVAMVGFGLIISVTMPELKAKAILLYDAKLTQEFYQTFVRAIFCGVLMYVAVVIFRDKKSVAGIFLAIPTFILCGFEHSIADMGYFAISGQFSLSAIAFILIVIVGNAVGGMLLPVLNGKLKINKTKSEVSDEKAN